MVSCYKGTGSLGSASSCSMRCAITCSVLCICCATLCGQDSSSLTLPQLITRDYLKLANPPTTTASSFFSHVTVESFGIGPAAVGSGYAFSNAYYASFYNLQGLECPLCVLGPQSCETDITSLRGERDSEAKE